MIYKIRLFFQFLYKFILNRFKLRPVVASEEVQKARLDECNGCPYRAKNTCMACGCIIRVKVKLQDSECPNNLWRI